MSRPTRALWAAALATGLVAAQEPPTKQPPTKPPNTAPTKVDDPATQAFTKLREEKQQLRGALGKKFEAAKTPEEQEKIRDEFIAAVRKLDLEFARKFPKHSSSLEMLVQNGSPEANELVLQHHLENRRLGTSMLQVAMALSQLGRADADSLFRAVQERSKDTNTKSMATLALAVSLKGQADISKDEKQTADLQAQAEKLFADAEKQFPALETPFGSVADFAKKNLFELRHLAVGKVAPDIDGKDVDDKPMKLSDYRGKVVLLDFWAHW